MYYVIILAPWEIRPKLKCIHVKLNDKSKVILLFDYSKSEDIWEGFSKNHNFLRSSGKFRWELSIRSFE